MTLRSKFHLNILASAIVATFFLVNFSASDDAIAQTVVIPDCPSVDEFPKEGAFDNKCGEEEKEGKKEEEKDRKQTGGDKKKDQEGKKKNKS